MKTSTFLVLGSCLLLQALPTSGSNRDSRASEAIVPLYHRQQAKELLGIERAMASEDVRERSIELALFVHRRVRELLPADWKSESQTISDALIETANRYEMDPLFLMSIINRESRFKPEAIGSFGEIGLMQLRPTTAQWMIDEEIVQPEESPRDLDALRAMLKDPVMNIAFGAAYLAKLRATFKGRGTLYVSAYNMGAVNVKNRLRNGQRPRVYADHIIGHYVAFTHDFNRAPQVPRRTVASLAVRTLGQ